MLCEQANFRARLNNQQVSAGRFEATLLKELAAEEASWPVQRVLRKMIHAAAYVADQKPDGSIDEAQAREILAGAFRIWRKP
jgi:hypothetical protein